jgi:hypothetical protein
MYTRFNYAEIFVSETPEFTDAEYAGISHGINFVHNLDLYDATRYYWVRFVSESNVKGPFSEMAGPANTMVDVQAVMESLTEKIEMASVDLDFSNKLGEIDTHTNRLNISDAVVHGTWSDAFDASGNPLQNDDGTPYQTYNNDGVVSSYSLKINNQGYVSGYGLTTHAGIDATPYSTFKVKSDAFVVSNGVSSTDTYPFMITDSKVYMDTALIRDGTITNAHVGNLDAANIVFTGELDGHIANLGTINSGLIQDHSGNLTINLNAGAIVARDDNGVERVRLGNLGAYAGLGTGSSGGDENFGSKIYPSGFVGTMDKPVNTTAAQREKTWAGVFMNANGIMTITELDLAAKDGVKTLTNLRITDDDHLNATGNGTPAEISVGTEIVMRNAEVPAGGQSVWPSWWVTTVPVGTVVGDRFAFRIKGDVTLNGHGRKDSVDYAVAFTIT